MTARAKKVSRLTRSALAALVLGSLLGTLIPTTAADADVIPPGSADTSFGTLGNSVLSGATTATGVAVVPTGAPGAGSIAVSEVSGNSDSTSFTVQYTNSSGASVWQHTPFTGKALSVTVAPTSGDVIAAGYETTANCLNGEPAVVEYNPAGALVWSTAGAPTTTGSPAWSTTGSCPIEGTVDSGRFFSVSEDSAGNVLAAGFVSPGNAGATEVIVARLTPAGALDTTFATNGFVATFLPTGTSPIATGVVAVTGASGDENEIAISGWGGDNAITGTTGFVAEFTNSGALDTKFGTADPSSPGRDLGVTWSPTNGSAYNGIVYIPGSGGAPGLLAVAGSTPSTNGTSFLVAEYTSAGALNTLFGSGGTVANSPAVTSSAQWNAIAYQPSGNLLVTAGIAGPSATASMALAQYSATPTSPTCTMNCSGLLNTYFGSNGLASNVAPSETSDGLGVVVQPDGKTVAAGTAPVVGAATEAGIYRVLGPTITVGSTTTTVTGSGTTTITVTVSLNEPLYGDVVPILCASGGAVVNGQGPCGTVGFPAGSTSAVVPITIDVTTTPGHSETVTITPQPKSGISGSSSTSGTITVLHTNPLTTYKGYWMVASDGGIFTFGDAGFFGSTGGVKLVKPIVGMAVTHDGKGYWLVASDGGIFTFGDAGYYGSTGGVALHQPIVGMAATTDGKGYWLVAADGGIFTFGDAGYYGSTGGVKLVKPIVGMAATPDGKGYWLVASDGGIFTFGDAGYYGSTGGVKLAQPIVGMASYPGAGGYWMVASDGGIFSFGSAGFHGSTGGVPLRQPIVGMAATPDGNGYWLVASDGGIFTFGDASFYGSTGGVKLAQPIVGMAG